MEIVKSSRHQKIIGNFGEALLCNWFSRSGFEVSLVDHTGIDIIAYNPSTKKRFRVSVKSRTRIERMEDSSVNLFSYQKEKSDREKVEEACEAFGCEPWIAIYVEKTESADLFLVSLKHYDDIYRGKKDRAIDDWKMGEKNIKKYQDDPDVRYIKMDFSIISWNWS